MFQSRAVDEFLKVDRRHTYLCVSKQGRAVDPNFHEDVRCLRELHAEVPYRPFPCALMNRSFDLLAADGNGTKGILTVTRVSTILPSSSVSLCRLAQMTLIAIVILLG